MKISTILDHIDSGHMALPEFQRGYVWNRDQVRKLMTSLYKRHPVGSLLMWSTESDMADSRGDSNLAPGVVQLILDGQQRLTTLYGLIRGKSPEFFEGNAKAFTDLRFHLDEEDFEFYQPIKMKDDPLWIDVTRFYSEVSEESSDTFKMLNDIPELRENIGTYLQRLNKLQAIKDREMHAEEVTEKSIDIVVEIFNEVNSGGTKLSRGDLALAKICAGWADGRQEMNNALKEWNDLGFNFSLDWLLRSVNTVVTGEAKFQYLHDCSMADIQEGLKKARKHINKLLNLIGSRLGLDHDRVLFGRFGLPVLVRYLEQQGGNFKDEIEQDMALFWYVSAAMWGRFSASTESVIDQDLGTIEGDNASLDNLLRLLRLWHGQFKIEPGHFTGWSTSTRFYPILYMLTRIGEAKDWGLGVPLKSHMLGSMSALEVHHIFPKSRLYKHGYRKDEVNAVANFAFQTKDTNLKISNRLTEDYFPEIETKYPGALASQWIPMDEDLWKIDRFPDFLEARRELLAKAANEYLDGLLHGKTMDDFLDIAAAPQPVTSEAETAAASEMNGEAEEVALENLNQWIIEQGLSEGEMMHEIVNADTGALEGVLDLAWPNGLQEGFSQPVAVILNDGSETLETASLAGFRFFRTVDGFRSYVEKDVLKIETVTE